jgi:hypothetical protein
MAGSKSVEVAVPAAAHELALLERVDYEDAFRVDAPRRWTPEQWMRAFVEGAPRWFQLSWIGGGRWLFGARFGPMESPDHVLGWKVLVDRPDVFAVGLDSSGGLLARMVALTPPGAALIATQMQLDPGLANTLFPGIRRGHRFFVPYLLDRAAHRAERENQAGRG